MTNPETWRPRHVFIGLTDVAGYYGNLATGFEELGIRTTFVDLSGNPYGYKPVAGSPPTWIRTIESLLELIRGRQGIGLTPRKVLWAAARMILKVPVGFWAIVRCDAFIFGFRTHFFGHFELPLLRALGKRSVFIFNGSDARPPYLNGQIVPATGPISGRSLVIRTKRMKRALRRIERWADAIIAHPPAAQLFERPYVPWLEIGIPYVASEAPAPPQSDGAHVTAVHAPTNPTAKGTSVIRAAIRELQRRGVSIEYVEVAGKSNEEVLERLRESDFLIDQTYSDTPMAGLATEAAALGRPTVVAGHELNEVRQHTRPDMWPPSFICRPGDLVEVIGEVATNSEMLLEMGRVACEFVSTKWSPPEVATRILDTLSGNMVGASSPSEHSGLYALGYGLPMDRVAAAIAATVRAGGADSLQTDEANRFRLSAVAREHGVESGPDQERHN